MSLNDLDIARSIPLRPLSEVARVMGVTANDLEPYGHTKAKIKLDRLKQPAKKQGKYIVVPAITPTPLGEGKTVHTVGLSQALSRIGKSACCVIRQPIRRGRAVRRANVLLGLPGIRHGDRLRSGVSVRHRNTHHDDDTHPGRIDDRLQRRR